MVKILGINGKVIITILYVYYWETNAGHLLNGNNIPKDEKKRRSDILEVWEPNPAFDFRRAETTKQITPDPKNGKATFRNKGYNVDKFTKGFRAEIGHNVPKYIPRNGQPHLEPIEMSRKYSADDDDYDIYKKRIAKSNTKKRHGGDKTHNNMDKKHYTDKTYTDDYRGTINDYAEDKNQFIKTKHHKGQNSTIKNSKVGREKGKNVHKNENKHNSNDKKHQSDKRITDEKRLNNKQYSSFEKQIDVIKANDQNNERHHKNDKTQTNDKHQNNLKHQNLVKDVTNDKHFSNDKQNIAKHQSNNKNHNNKQLNDYENPNKNKFSKDKNHLREKGHSKNVGIQVITTKARESKWPVHHHRAKLRTHDDHPVLRSTRMTPMYLMQQPPEDQEKEVKTSTVEQPDNAAYYLSPYSLATQMKRIMDEFTDANVTTEVLGRTVEYNDILIFKMTESKNDKSKFFRAAESKYIDEVPEKRIIFIVHALSVMGIGSVPCLLTEPDLKIVISYYVKHLKLFDIFLMPMANPDGYSAVHSNYIWNKNMSPQEACPGVALDRNFDVAWNSSKKLSSCSQMFPGKTPFSETETKAVRDVFHYHGHKIIAYIHVHAGTYTDQVFKGDAILYPRGFTEVQSDDDKYIDLKGEIDEAMKNASFQVLSVTVDTLHNWYGKVSGTSVDYAATVYGIPYALEFVMQSYSYDGDAWQHALTEIWSRLIDTSFKNIFKSLRSNEIRRK